MNPRLSLLYAGLSVSYLAIMHLTPFEGDFVVKAAPVLLLAGITFTTLSGRSRWLLLAAQIFSAGGDAALTFVRGVNQNYFILGLGLFLVAHIFYCILFTGTFAWRKDRLWMGALLLAFSVTMAVILVPRLGDLAPPVCAYVAVITTMGLLSMMRQGSDYLLIAGALVFILSDSCIAVNKFLQPFEGASYAIMITYYAAQWMIAKAIIAKKK